MTAKCPKCYGEGWVCEAHLDRPWLDGKGCCGAPGVPCSCNPNALNPPGFKVTCEPDSPTGPVGRH